MVSNNPNSIHCYLLYLAESSWIAQDNKIRIAIASNHSVKEKTGETFKPIHIPPDLDKVTI